MRPCTDICPGIKKTLLTRWYLITKIILYQPNKIVKAQQAEKERYDKTHRGNVNYVIGDIVYITINPVAIGLSTKLQPRSRGPYVITNVLPSDTYVIENLCNKRKQSIRQTCHVSQIKIWRGEGLNEDEVESVADEVESVADEVECEANDLKTENLNRSNKEMSELITDPSSMEPVLRRSNRLREKALVKKKVL